MLKEASDPHEAAVLKAELELAEKGETPISHQCFVMQASHAVKCVLVGMPYLGDASRAGAG